jgi:pimeloyl-ACP methyl ester carboxylesterase
MIRDGREGAPGNESGASRPFTSFADQRFRRPVTHARLILLPGLGADARMYGPQRAAFPRLDVLRWVEPRRRETLADYSARLADGVGASEPFVLGGSSFGGPVALEMAKRLKPEAVLLIGSFRSARSIPLAFRCAARLAGYAPGPLLRAIRGVNCRSTYMFGDLDAAQHVMMVSMMRDADPRFIQWGGAALTRWAGAGELPIPVHHIHGGDDRIIPCHRVRPDVIVPGAGHLLNVTHADVVNRFIAERVEPGHS